MTRELNPYQRGAWRKAGGSSRDRITQSLECRVEEFGPLPKAVGAICENGWIAHSRDHSGGQRGTQGWRQGTCEEASIAVLQREVVWPRRDGKSFVVLNKGGGVCVYISRHAFFPRGSA